MEKKRQIANSKWQMGSLRKLSVVIGYWRFDIGNIGNFCSPRWSYGEAGRSQAGFTLTELIIVMGITLTLLSIATVSFFRTQHNSSLQSRLETVITDMRSQQTRAMAGEITSETSAVPYGIYFSTTSYTLYKGGTYNPSDTSNTVVQLEPALQFNAITFPSSLVQFDPISGEVAAYSAAQDTVTLQDTVTGEAKTITVNSYGVPVEVN